MTTTQTNGHANGSGDRNGASPTILNVAVSNPSR
jgi:hypothetical protein